MGVNSNSNCKKLQAKITQNAKLLLFSYLLFVGILFAKVNIATNMNIIAWIVFGAIAGLVANLIDPRPSSGGLLGAVVLGILGAIVGGFLANMLFGMSVTGFNLNSFIIAVLGSLLHLFIGRALRSSGRSI